MSWFFQSYLPGVSSSSPTCCFVLLVGLTEKCKSFMAPSISVTVYGLFVSGLTHLSATVVAMSLNIDSNWACLSFSDTCNSPFAKIWNRALLLSFHSALHSLGCFYSKWVNIFYSWNNKLKWEMSAPTSYSSSRYMYMKDVFYTVPHLY